VVLGFFAPFGRVYLVIVVVADLFFLLSVLKIARGDTKGSQKALKKRIAVALVAFLAAALLQMNPTWV
jgi:4-hydroxybenzoate polyprenyltransferase